MKYIVNLSFCVPTKDFRNTDVLASGHLRFSVEASDERAAYETAKRNLQIECPKAIVTTPPPKADALLDLLDEFSGERKKAEAINRNIMDGRSVLSPYLRRTANIADR